MAMSERGRVSRYRLHLRNMGFHISDSFEGNLGFGSLQILDLKKKVRVGFRRIACTHLLLETLLLRLQLVEDFAPGHLVLRLFPTDSVQLSTQLSSSIIGWPRVARHKRDFIASSTLRCR